MFGKRYARHVDQNAVNQAIDASKFLEDRNWCSAAASNLRTGNCVIKDMCLGLIV